MKKGILQLAILGTAVSLSAQVTGIALRWDSLTFRGGPRKAARSIAVTRNRIIAGEVVGSPTGGTDVLVEAFRAGGGNVAWSDTFPNAGIVLVEAAGHRAFAAVRTVDGLLIRAYD